MKIRTKLLLFPFILAIMMIISLFVDLIITDKILKKRVENYILTTSQSRANHIKTLLKNYQAMVRMIAAEGAFTKVLDRKIDYSGRMTKCNLKIKQIIEINSDISRIRIVNNNGIVIAASHKDSGLDISNDELFIKGKKSVYLGEIHKSKYTSKYVLCVSTPISTGDKYFGVLIIDFDVENQLFNIALDKTGLKETGDIYLLNKDCYMITPSRFDSGVILKAKLSSEQVNLHLLEHLKKGSPESINEKPTIYLNYAGNKVMGVHYFIAETQWFLIVEFNIDEVLRETKMQIILMITIFFSLLVISIIVAGMISRNITLRIKKLLYGTSEIINGNLDYQITIKSDDEIGQLSRIFGSMTRKLKYYTENLRTMIQEKTVELEKQFMKSEKQRIATLVVLNDLNKKTSELKAEITNRKQIEIELINHQENLEKIVIERTSELEEKNNDLERYNRLFEDREFRIKELKDKVKELEGKN